MTMQDDNGFVKIQCTVNGSPRSLFIDRRKSLLELLRQDLGLTGTKEGCGVGECGACSVLVDEVLVDSCLYLAVWVDGKAIRTVEGEAKNGKLSPVQQAYVEEGAVQCGFCTPGFIMASTSFVEKHQGQEVNEAQIRKGHAGNLCRCTGYQNILKAVEKAVSIDSPMQAEKNQIFNTLKQLASLMTNMFGDNCEVVIHDLTTEKMQLVHITGKVTRRIIGAPVTDVVKKYLLLEGNGVEDRHCFKTLMDDGSELKSSTSYIRNCKGEVIYAFCVNFNTTDHHNAIQMLQAFVNKTVTQRGAAGKHASGPEKMSFSIDHTADSFFEQSVMEIGKRPASMNTEEKIRLVKILETKGAFQIKGMVGQVALRLGVSNFTIYNYLKKIRATNGISIIVT